jgi:hypothetical protein
MGIEKLYKFGEAVYAGVLTGLGSLAAIMVGDANFGDITEGQWLVVVVSALTAFGGILGLQKSGTTTSVSEPPPKP